MKKAFLALCMMLCVSLAATALAAPCRDVRTEGRDAELENAVSLFAGAALMRDVTDFTEGEAVPQPLAEGVLLLGFGRHLLASTDGNPSDETETADAAALQPILSSLFSGDSQVPETPSCPCITRSGDQLVFDITDVDVESAGGAYIFSRWLDGERVVVLADLYNAIAYFGEEIAIIPEECISWVRTAMLTLERDSASPVGYRLVSMTAYPDWLDGSVNEFELTLGEDYEVSLPPFLRLSNSEDGTDTYVADGIPVQLTIQTLAAQGQDPLDAAREAFVAGHPDAAIVMEPQLSYFTGETDGAYTFVVCPDGAESMRVLTLTFPSERQYEFSFYGEIIRNSFWCEGMGLG